MAIRDGYGGKVLAWRRANSIDASIRIEALKGALAKHGTRLLFDSDQLISGAWIDLLIDALLKTSMRVAVGRLSGSGDLSRTNASICTPLTKVQRQRPGSESRWLITTLNILTRPTKSCPLDAANASTTEPMS